MVNLKISPSSASVFVFRKSTLILGKNAVKIAKAVKVNPSNVAKTVAIKGIAALGTVFRNVLKNTMRKDPISKETNDTNICSLQYCLIPRYRLLLFPSNVTT